jgi:hypothetical protein
MISRHYDSLKVIAQIWLPGLGTLYFTLAQIWGLPFAAEIVGSITAVDTFLGVLLRVSAGKYTPPSDGTLDIDMSDPEKERYKFNLTTPLEDMSDKQHILLTVDPGADLGSSQGKQAL